ncbi:MAG TPA: hypothetical protein VFT19_00535 [Solirubrobacterales bacterium]|nr:hypothetical protein [Solirubrobacterales bacterium]
MASRPRERPGAASGGLSVEAAHHFARVYASARAGCLAELRRFGCDEGEAEEIFAATLERIMRRRDPLGEGFNRAQTVALLKQACRQKAIDERRHRDVLQIAPLKEALTRSDPTTQSVAEAAEAREAVAIGREAIASLPERDRRLFLQRHRLGLTPEEILRRNPGLRSRTYRKVIQRANARALAAFEAIDSGARCAEMRAERLRRLVAEQASGAERDAIEAHLRHCRSCSVEVARMRGRLGEIASTAALLAVAEGPAGGRAGDLPARLLDAAGGGAEALIGTTRALRERLRELAIRATGVLPGSGGDAVAGQVAGLSAAKVASVCVAGTLAAGCLAAGVVPGIGLEPAGSGVEERSAQPPQSPSLPQRSDASESPVSSPAPSATTHRPESRSRTGSRRARARRSTPRAPDTDSAGPTVSGVQTGTEFGAEAAGAGTPAPNYSSGARESGGGSTGGSRSSTASEFGL